MGSLGERARYKRGYKTFKAEKVLQLEFAELVRVQKSRWKGWASKKWRNSVKVKECNIQRSANSSV